MCRNQHGVYRVQYYPRFQVSAPLQTGGDSGAQTMKHRPATGNRELPPHPPPPPRTDAWMSLTYVVLTTEISRRRACDSITMQLRRSQNESIEISENTFHLRGGYRLGKCRREPLGRWLHSHPDACGGYTACVNICGTPSRCLLQVCVLRCRLRAPFVLCISHFKNTHPCGISSVFTPRHDGIVENRELYR